ncbi:MAG: ABC transporter ATP-binding protein [Christensenellaceae bacterium]|nr:ABC transporter ATP-binding protein [Christensenellaceae bacterium]PWM60526.1 MAG: thiamine ABC transporter permease [Clostridia bacterium]
MHLVKRFVSYYKPHRKLFAIDMACAFIVAVCDLFYPIIAGNIIDDYVPNQNLRLLLIWSGVLLGIYLVKAVLNYVIQYWGHIVGVRIQGDMRRDMFRHMQKLPFAFFDENKTGTLLSRMVNDLQDVSELAHHGPEDLFLSLIMLVGSFIILAGTDLLLTVIIFAFLPVMVFVASKLRKGMQEAFRATRVEVGEVNANVETAIAGMRVSRSYTAASHENRKFDSANERFKLARGRAYREMGKFHSSMTLFNDLLYLIVLVAGGLFFFYGRISIGDFTKYILFITMFLKPINRLVNIFEQLQNGMTGFQRFVEIMDQKDETDTGTIEADALRGNIVFDHVSFRYENSDARDVESKVIHDLSMHIEPGKTVALVGPSGGGKTTICNLIPRFYEADEGTISIDGVDIRDLTRESLRRNIGIVAQDVFLFNGSIRENIAYGNLDATDEEIVEAAKKAHIHDYIMTLDHGYDTGVGERGVKLSGGQKQRISIARVFLKNPSILILDEATSALDNATEMLIQQALNDLSHGRTCIVVAHRLSTIKNADEIIVLTKDGITERGTHEALIAAGGMYAKLYQYQFRE